MWNEKYSVPGYVYGLEANDFLARESASISEGGKVLCIAEGEGRNAVFLASQGFVVKGIDQSHVGLEKAKKLANEKGVAIETEVADLEQYDFGTDCWDGIVSIFAHTPPAIRKKVHQKVLWSLKTGGVFLLEAYTEHQLVMSGVGGPPETMREMFMSLDELKVELSELDILRGEELERGLFEGKYHRGPSSVVQIVARKS